MRKVLSYLFTLVVVAIYIVSTMGYGVHECKLDGTKDIVVLFGETPCEYIHSHIDKSGHIYTHAHDAAGSKTVEAQCGCGCALTADALAEGNTASFEHNDNCCHTTVYSITHDQTIEDNAAIAISYMYIAFALRPLDLSYSFPLSPVFLGSLSRLKEKKTGIEGELYLSNKTFRV